MWYTEGGEYQYQAPLYMILDREIGIFVDVFCFSKEITSHISTYCVSTPNKDCHSCLTSWFITNDNVDSRVFHNLNFHNQLFRCLKQLHLPF